MRLNVSSGIASRANARTTDNKPDGRQSDADRLSQAPTALERITQAPTALERFARKPSTLELLTH